MKEQEGKDAGGDYSEELIEKLAREFWQWLMRQDIAVHQWIQALASVALLGVTFSQLLVSCNSSTQTDQLLRFASTTSTAAQQFSTAAGQIKDSMGQAVSKLNIQASETGDLATSTGNVATAASDEVTALKDSARTNDELYRLEAATNRATISVEKISIVDSPELSGEGRLDVELKNHGKAAATNVQYKRYDGSFDQSSDASIAAISELETRDIAGASNLGYQGIETPDIVGDGEQTIPIGFFANNIDKTIFVAGTVDYIDGTDTKRWKHFCIQINTSERKRGEYAHHSAGACPIFQDAGVYPEPARH